MANRGRHGTKVFALLITACASNATPAPTTPAPPAGPPSYAVTVTSAKPEYAPTATVATDDAVHAGVTTVMHVDIRFPTTAPGELTAGYTGFAVGHPGPVTFTAPEGVVVDPAAIKLRGDPSVTVTHENVAFDARLTAPAAGATPISAEIKYALCDAEHCLVLTATLRWSIDVVPA